MKYEYEVSATILDTEGNMIQQSAPALEDIETILKRHDASKEFEPLLDLEELLGDDAEEEIRQIDANADSYHDDGDEPAEVKMGMAKWQIENSLRAQIVFLRNDMIAKYGNGGR